MSTLRRGLLRGAVAGLFLLAVGLASDSSAQPPPGVLQTFKGHTDPVYAIAFSPDGKYVVTGSFDKAVKIWDATTGKEFRSFAGEQGHKNLVLTLAVSGDGSEVATGSADNTARTWDFPGQTPLRAIDLPADGTAVALAADGQKAAVALKDGTVKVFNPADGKQLYTLKGHAGPVTHIALSANNQHLLTAGADRTLRFWNPADGKPVAVVGAHAGPITGLAIRPDNSAAAFTSSEDGTVKFWTLPGVGSRGLAAAHGGTVTGLALSADGNQLFTASADKTIRQSTTANGQQVKAFGPATGGVASLALKGDGQLVAGGLDNGQVQLYTVADGKDAGRVQAHAGAVTGLAFNPANNALVSVGADGLLRTWASPLVAARALPHPEAVTAAIGSPDGKRVFTASGDKTIYAWNPAAPQAPERKFVGHPTPITALAVKADGQLLASAGDDGVIRFWNATNSQAGETILAHAGAVTSLGFVGDGTKLYSSGVDGSVRLWQVPAAGVKPLAHPEAVLAAVPTADGNGLVTSSGDKQVRLWNLQKGEAKAFAGLAQPAGAIAVSPNAALVAAGSAEKAVLVWNAADAKEAAKFSPTAGVQSLAFHGDNKTLAAGLADGNVVVYDVAQKKDLKTWKAHGGAVNALAFLPSGDLVSSGADKTVQVWNPADGASKAKLDTPAPVVAISPSKDGARLAAAGADKAVKVWTLADKKEVGSFASPAEVRGVGLSPDGQRVAVAGADNRVRLHEIDGKLVESFAHDGPVSAAGFLADGKRLYSAGADKTARILSPSLVWVGQHAGPVRQAVLSGKGDRVVSGGDDKQVRVWNAADGKVVEAMPTDGPVTGVATNAEATRLAAAVGAKVELLDATKKGAKLATYPLPAAATGLAMSPNGTRVAGGFAADGKQTVHVWDSTPGKEAVTTPLQVLPDCTGAIRSLGFLADNRTLLTAEADKNARLLDVAATGVFKAHDGAATGLSLHSNGTQAVTTGADKLVKMWDLAQGKAVKTFGPLAGPATAATFARDYTQVGAASGKQVRVWNVADGKDVATLEHPADVKSLSFSGDKARLATAGTDGQVRVWDLATKAEMLSFPHDGPVETVVYHANNVNVLAGGADKNATVHTIGLAKVVPVGSPVRSLAVAPNGANVLTGADDKSLKFWNTGSGAMERAFGQNEAVGRASAIAKNSTFAAVAGADKQLRVYNFGDGKLVGSFPLSADATSVSVSPAAPLVTVTTKDGGVATYNVAFTAGQPLPADFGASQLTYRHGGEAADVVYSADGKLLLTTGGDKKLTTWKVPAAAATRNFAHPALVDAVAFAPDGKTLATGCHDGKLRFFDLAKNAIAKEVNAFPAPAMPAGQPPYPVYCLAFTADGKQVLAGGLEKSAKLYEVASGNLVKELKAYKEKEFEAGHKDGVFSLAIAPDGKLFATGSSDKTVKLWNPADGSVVRTLTNPNLKASGPTSPPPSHPGSVYGVRFIEGGQKLLTVGSAPRGLGYLAVWNVADGKLLHGEEVPLGTLYALAVSADGGKIALGTGASVRTAGDEANNAYLMQTPKK